MGTLEINELVSPKDEDSLENILNSKEEFSLESWSKLTGLKIRNHNEEELDAFKKPFLIGWKRELNLRPVINQSNKKLVDVFYISPCKQVRLKSYVEMGVYLRNDEDCQLEPENFTFAKQPIYKFPEEIIKLNKFPVRPVVKNEQNGVIPQMPQLVPITENKLDETSDLIKTPSKDETNLNNSIAEGRSKRKRNAPTRFEDEDYLEQTLTKKKIIKTSNVTPTSKQSSSKINLLANQSKQPITNSNKKENLNSSLSISTINGNDSNKTKTDNKEINLKENLVVDASEKNEENISNKPEKVPEPENNSLQLDSNYNVINDASDNESLASNSSLNNKTNELSNQNSPEVIQQSIKPVKNKSVKKSVKIVNDQNDENVNQDNINLPDILSYNETNVLENGNLNVNNLSENEMVISESKEENLPIPPCSLLCGGRKGDFPSLRCSKCLCLFHPQCVKNGIFLKETMQFVCPNCIQPSDIPNAIEDSSKLLEQSVFKEQENKKAERFNNLNMPSHHVNFKSSSKGHNNPKFNFNKLDFTSVKMNGYDHKKKLNNNNIRSPGNMNSRFNQNQLSSNNNNSNLTNNRSKFDYNNFNSQLNKKLNQFNLHQQNLLNLKSSLNHLTNGVNTNSSYASRKSHLENMNKSLLSSQQLLQSIKKVTSLSMIKPNEPQNHKIPNNAANLNTLSVDNSNETSNKNLPKKTNSRKFFEYFNQNNNAFKTMINGYQALQHIFSYLSVRDLNQCKLVNKTFNSLVSEPVLWKKLNLKNLIINDWEHFSCKIFYQNDAEELCLEGIRLPNISKGLNMEEINEIENEMWRNYKSCYNYFASLKKLKLGKISTENLAYLLTETENQNNPLFNLEELSIKNLYEENTYDNLCSLKVIEKLVNCKNLRLLRIESKQGISNDETTIQILNNLQEILPFLKALYLPNLKCYSIDNFSFLMKLTQLECLEIGSCESWTTFDVNETQTDQVDDQVLNNSSNELEEEKMETLDDEEFINENQENEFNDNSNLKKSIKYHKGAFKYLSQLKNLKELYLTDVIIDETSNQLPMVVEKMRHLESLGLGYVTVSPDATQTLNMLCNTLKTKLPYLKKFSISTEDSHTNKCVFDLLLKRLDNLEELKWKVTSQVEDNGTCLIPFVKEREIESDLENEDNLDLTINNDYIEMMETCYLNDILQKHLSKTRVIILPQ